jgi:asparagine synthase (glutamine-hydrolysing)
MTTNDPDSLYREITEQGPGLLLPGASELPIAISDRASWPRIDDYIERMMYFDQVSYLPDDILVKVDRASMAVSLEAREPLLDHRLIEFAWRLPLSMKLREGGGKWILKKVLARYVPQTLVERPKMGFGLPIDQWLRGPLRDWAEPLLSERRLRDEGYFDVAAVRQSWLAFQSGYRESLQSLWSVLMFQAWLERAAL